MLLRHIYALVSDESLHKSNKNESCKKSNNLKLRNQYSKKIAYILKKHLVCFPNTTLVII